VVSAARQSARPLPPCSVRHSAQSGNHCQQRVEQRGQRSQAVSAALATLHKQGRHTYM
jgi:hypothetical protein